MSEVLSGVANGAPIWVWPLLIVLLFVGLRATRKRSSSIFLYYGLPFLAILSMRTVFIQPNQMTAWLCFLSAYAAGAALAYRWQSRWLVEKSGNRISLRGEWVTLITVMIIFWSNFANGMVLDIAPAAQNSLIFTAIFTATIGWASGTFLGRTLYVLRS